MSREQGRQIVIAPRSPRWSSRPQIESLRRAISMFATFKNKAGVIPCGITPATKIASSYEIDSKLRAWRGLV
jgi:hypothetical protein